MRKPAVSMAVILTALLPWTAWGGEGSQRVGTALIESMDLEIEMVMEPVAKMVMLGGKPAGTAMHQGGQGGGHGGPAMAGPRMTHHLELLVSDVNTRQFVPYLPVTATVRGDGGAFAVKLHPMLGMGGLHYGANISLPAKGRYEISFRIDPPEVMAYQEVLDLLKEKGKYLKPAHASFSWEFR